MEQKGWRAEVKQEVRKSVVKPGLCLTKVMVLCGVKGIMDHGRVDSVTSHGGVNRSTSRVGAMVPENSGRA